MSYEKTLEFLFSQLPAYHRIGKAAYKNDLGNSLALDRYLNHPHHNFKSIHIAGTNGKGSVSHMIASVFQEAGYKTGLYTSPHMKDFRERIKINGEMIGKDEVIKFVKDHSEFIGSLKPSFFEMTVAMAFDHFSRQKVDIAIIETGLGGRLDSTNIIIPELSLITNIGHDHMDLLGDTIEKVAEEKSGIIKFSVPVIISESQPETESVFISKANATGSEILFADKNFSCHLEEDYSTDGERSYVIEDLSSNESAIGKIPLGGDYQSKNIQAVWQVCKTMRAEYQLSEEIIKSGIKNVIKNTGLMGRWQILSHNPYIVCDSGHNREGLVYVMNQISKMRKSGLHMVVGFVNDKDLDSVLPLFPKSAIYYFTKASVPRALDEKVLMDNALLYGLKGSSFPDVKSALNAAVKEAAEDDIIFVGGSTFVVADAL